MPLCLPLPALKFWKRPRHSKDTSHLSWSKLTSLASSAPNLFLSGCPLSHWRRRHQPVSCSSMGLTFNSLFFHLHQVQSINQSPGSVNSAYQRSPYPPTLLSIYPFIHLSIHPSFHACIHPSIHPLINPSIHPSVHLFFHFSPAHSCGPHLGCQHFSPGWLRQSPHCPRGFADCPQLTESFPFPLTARVVLLQCWLDHDASYFSAYNPIRGFHGPAKSHLFSMIQLGFWDLAPASFSVTTCAESYLFSTFTLAIPSTWVLKPPLSMAPLLQFSGLKCQVLPEASPDPPYSGLHNLHPL